MIIVIDAELILSKYWFRFLKHLNKGSADVLTTEPVFFNI